MAVTRRNGTEIAYAAYEPHTQVYYASHSTPQNLSNYEWYRKKYMYRSFISFSFGGKWIEDFNLIAATNGDRLVKDVYGGFENTTSSYDVLDGQFYWGTHFTNRQLTFTLVTDGITQAELESFRNWFAPGTTRELILAEHPNRAIQARIAGNPSLSVIPFEHKTTVKINRVDYETSTTLYKGEINITFDLDKPFWHSVTNILARQQNGTWVDKWIGANGDLVSIFEDKDALKVIAEDGVPARDMIGVGISTGSGITTDSAYTIVGPSSAAGTGHTNGTGTNTTYAEVNAVGQTTNYGFIGPLIRSSDAVSLNANAYGYLYYCGTAPSRPTINFTLSPVLSNNYVSTPINSFNGSTNAYNTITLQYNETQEFKISAPSIYLSYNRAIKIFKEMQNETPWTDIVGLIKENVSHYYARKWALMVVAYYQTSGPVVTSAARNAAHTYMSYFLKNPVNTTETLEASFSFNSETGESIGEIKCRKIATLPPAGADNWPTYGTVVTLTENVGDMVKSKYLIIKERNLPDNDGKITNSVCHKFYHNFSGGLRNFSISYKYQYY